METWREIAGYEGLYAISSLGRIKRLEHWKNQKTARSDKYYQYKKLSEKILRPYSNEYDIYHKNGGNSYLTEKVNEYKVWYNQMEDKWKLGEK